MAFFNRLIEVWLPFSVREVNLLPAAIAICFHVLCTTESSSSQGQKTSLQQFAKSSFLSSVDY